MQFGGCLGPNPGFFIGTSVANATISTLVSTCLNSLFGLLGDVFNGIFVRAFVVFFAVKRAELARQGADVCVIRVAVDVVVGGVAVDSASDEIGQFANGPDIAAT